MPGDRIFENSEFAAICQLPHQHGLDRFAVSVCCEFASSLMFVIDDVQLHIDLCYSLPNDFAKKKSGLGLLEASAVTVAIV